MRIRAIAVFERVVYNCIVTDGAHPERPILEVDAVMREGDGDGALLLPAPTYIALLGGLDRADPILRDLDRKGRVVDHDGIRHLAFPTWEVVDTT